MDKLLRLAIPVGVTGRLIGQTAFGTDEMFTDGRENVAHRFLAVDSGGECLAVFNNCTYGFMFEEDTVYLSLLRGAAYCTHPIPGRRLVPENRYIKRIDQCEHTYSFRVAVAKREELERMALEFNQKPFVQNVFPAAVQNAGKTERTLLIENKNISLAALKKSAENDGYVIRLMNNDPCSAKTKISLGGEETELTFGRYEVKTLLYGQHGFRECRELIL